jgi:hypothetical protein
MAIPATQIIYRLTTLACNDLTTDPTRPFQATMSPAGFTIAGTDALLNSFASSVAYNEITTPKVIPSQIADATASVGAVDQYLTAGVGGSVVWANLPAEATHSLAEILAVSPAGVASSGQTISGLASLGLVNADNSVVLSSTLVSGVNMALNVNTVADDSGDTKDFSRKYLPIGVGNVIYYLPLFSVPVPV